MSNTPITVNNVKGAGDSEAAKEVQPGALSGFSDGSWIFTGNGETTPEDVAQRILTLGGKDVAALGELAGLPAGARIVASYYLGLISDDQLKGLGIDGKNLPPRDQNTHLMALNVKSDSALPVGKQFHVDANNLKNLLAPFKKNLAVLQNLVAAQSGGSNLPPNGNPYSPGVRTPGIGLPADPRL